MDIEIESDFDGFFEKLVRTWIQRKIESCKTFNYSKVVISAGPYRANAVTTRKLAEGVLGIDFYSALRVGMGALSEDDVNTIIEIL